MINRRRRIATVSLCLAVLAGLAACGDSSDSASSGVPTPTPSTSSAPTVSPEPTSNATPVAAEPGAPSVGTCRDYAAPAVEPRTNSAKDVPCTQSHTAETFRVSTVAKSEGDLAKLADARLTTLGDTLCSQKDFASWLGTDITEVSLSRWTVAYYLPELSQIKAGDRWVRCEAVLRDANDLVTTTGTAKGIFKTAPAVSFATCIAGKAADRANFGEKCRSEAEQWVAAGRATLPPALGVAAGSAKELANAKKVCAPIVKKESRSATTPSLAVPTDGNPALDGANRAALCLVAYDGWVDGPGSGSAV